MLETKRSRSTQRVGKFGELVWLTGLEWAHMNAEEKKSLSNFFVDQIDRELPTDGQIDANSQNLRERTAFW